jgi:hypothetical protein
MVKRVMSGESASVLAKYVELCHKYNMTMHNEGTKLEDFLKTLEEQAQEPAVQIENSVWRVTVLPEHNGAVAGLYHKPSGHELLRAMQNFNLDRGILETFVETGPYRRTWNMECTAQSTPNSITCTKQLKDGTVEERTIRLSNDKPEPVQVEFALTQHGAEPQGWRFDSQIGFHPGSRTKDSNVLAVLVKNGGWQQVNKGWVVDKGPKADLLSGPTDGAMAFFNNEAHFGALVQYPVQQVGDLRLFWHPERPQVNFDLRTPKVTLAPGQRLGLQIV